MKKKILTILMFVVILFSMTGCGGVKIRQIETKSLKYVEYNNGLVKLKVPEGWKVDVIGDYIHYTVKAYDPNNPTYQFFFNLKTEGYNKSEAAKAWQKKFYPNEIFAKNPVISTKDTEGFYKIFNELGPLNNTSTFTFPTITDFTVVEKLGKGLVGGDVLRATFKDKDGNDAEGLFSAYVYDVGPHYVSEDFFSAKQVDIQYLSVYDTMFITAPKDEFINWEEPLSIIASSLEFTDKFLSGFNSEQDAVMKNFQNVRNICNQITDGIMDSWEKRNASFDIMSQKQSDATLGYERVYDTKTGEVYKAYNGFTDDYDGKRYKTITDDMYTKGISGYIEK
ncbi:MAG: hypothetical protein MR297_00960 [Tenericutes bacterium]|nr:hypothetical protein [Mycoplasmatota bacterium]